MFPQNYRTTRSVALSQYPVARRNVIMTGNIVDERRKGKRFFIPVVCIARDITLELFFFFFLGLGTGLSRVYRCEIGFCTSIIAIPTGLTHDTALYYCIDPLCIIS